MQIDELMKKAKQELATAEYMSSVTSGVVRDRNVLLSVLLHADHSVFNALLAFLLKAKETKRLKLLPQSEELQRQIFFHDHAGGLGISGEDRQGLLELNQIAEAHRKNQLEFQHGDEFIIVLNDYRTVTVDKDGIRKYLNLAKAFVDKIEERLL
jgi:hypothetical protein